MQRRIIVQRRNIVQGNTTNIVQSVLHNESELLSGSSFCDRDTIYFSFSPLNNIFLRTTLLRIFHRQLILLPKCQH